MGVDVRRSGERFLTVADGLETRHSFSFGRHYDPADTSFGLLLACNEDRVAPGAGYDRHPHRDLEIVTWVLDGALTHRDDAGAAAVVRPGGAQRLSAGRGVAHSERNDGDVPAHFVQMWLAPDTPDAEPGHAAADLTAALAGGGPVAVAAGGGRPAALTLRQRDAVLWAARPAAGSDLALPDAAFVHVLVTRGAVALPDGTALAAGDAVRLTGGGGPSLGRPALGVPADGAEVLVWEMARALA